jgi:hypothetical protein
MTRWVWLVAASLSLWLVVLGGMAYLAHVLVSP